LVGAEFRPHTIALHELERSRGEHATLREALSEVGMVSIVDLPGFVELRRRVLGGAQACLRDLPEEDARSHIFEDGTERRTLALSVHDVAAIRTDVPSCARLSEALSGFRELVGGVQRTFARNLGAMLEFGGKPLLVTKDGAAYETLESLFENGDHLDHVHSYHLQRTHQRSDMHTMDLHTDQGLCIAFAPALMVEEVAGGALRGSGKVAGKFHVQLQDESIVEVGLRDDELIFMLGDGVNQYINPKKLDGPELRAVPHALTMPQHVSNEWRVWFGRMFLPPGDAVSEEHGMTFEEISGMMSKAWLTEESQPRLNLGCSRGQRAAELRQLDAVAPPCSSGARRRCSGSCANNQLQCWWRCMNHTDLAATCSSGEHVNCTNRRDEISLGKDHGDYDLQCTSSTTLLQGNCEIEQINKDRPNTCSSSGFETFMQDEGDYKGRHVLSLNDQNEPEVVFKWKLEESKVKAMLAFNGKASWMAVGMENFGASKNGMQGAPVVLGISANDDEFQNLKGSVREYRIHDSESRLRNWNTPYAFPAVTGTEMLETGCYTAMKFTTDSFFGEALNITSGSNRLIWALRASSYMHIGKDSYHEGCDGTTSTRYRGGGAKSPWVVDFNNYLPEDDTQTNGCDRGYRIVGALVGLAIFTSSMLHA